MKTVEYTCILCPRGCHVTLTDNNGQFTISGNFCPKGVGYAKSEYTAPMRTVTSTITVNGHPHIKRVPVKTDKPIDKRKIFELLDIIHKTVVKYPINVNDILIENVLDTDVNIVATRTVME